MGIGSSGAEGLAAAHLTSSLDNSMLIAPMPLSDLSVQPVPLRFLHLDQLAHQIAQASVKLVQLILHCFVQFVAGIIWMLEIYSISRFLLCFDISATD